MPINYKDAGVDVANGQKEVELIKKLVEKTQSENVLSKLGGFSGLFSLENLNIKNPVLVSGTDGVGTKVMLAQMMDKHDTIGIDCVAMCVNDILCQGAKPLFFLDYIACGKLVPEKMEKIVKKDLTVDIKISDRLKESKIINVSEQSTKKITVSGLRNYVDKVDKIVLNINEEEYLDGKIHDIGVKAVDKDGKAVENVDLSQNDVSISFDVLQSKEVGVELNYDNLPKNMQIEESKISPNKVILKGEKSIVDKISAIKTREIDLSNLKNDEFEQRVELEIPQAVELNEGDYFVNVYVKLGKKN